MKNIYILLFTICSYVAVAQTERLILPSSTDAAIDSFNNTHVAIINTDSNARNQLVVFIPGTTALPVYYKKFLGTAANMGFHAIGLTYINAQAINAICGPKFDTTCFENARLEVIDGIDRNPDIHITRTHSIENRLVKLLKYLDANFPTEGWDQYWTADSTIVWSKIVIAGHSQGGGHAGIIAKHHKVARCLMFSSMDRYYIGNKAAHWTNGTGQTPAADIYGFAHEEDELTLFNWITDVWQALGLYQIGNLINVDTLNPPYNNSHTLTTLLLPNNDTTRYHSSTIVDAFTPLDNNNLVYLPVWQYMLTAKTNVGINIPSNLSFNIYPNPAKDFLTIDLSSINKSIEIRVTDLSGKTVLKTNANTPITRLDISELNRGQYFLQVQFEHNQIVKPLQILK